MKRNCIFMALALLYYLQLNAQSNHKQDSIRYLAAYEYIVNDTLDVSKGIYVLDTIVDLDRWPFIDEINDALNENKTDKDYWKFEWKENEYSPLLASLFPQEPDNAESILIFSPIEDDMISAVLVPRKRYWNGELGVDFNVSWILSFTEGHVYLFIFDENDNMKGAYRHLMIYD